MKNEFNVVEIIDTTWEHLVEDSSKPVIVMFYSPKCSFCEVMEPYFMNNAQEFKNSAVFARMDIVTNPWTAERYGVQGHAHVQVVLSWKTCMGAGR